MKTVLTTYTIGSQTLALLPAKQIDYDTVVIKQSGTKYVRQTPLKLIKAACYDDWTTYEGRRQAVTHHTNFKQKVPIPISIDKGIYLFPTHSPRSIHNSWIAYQHIAFIKKAPQHNPTGPAQSIIHYKNGQTLQLDISMHILKAQIQRTFECMYRIEGRKKMEFNSSI